MLSFDPDCRPTTTEILNHPFFESLERSPLVETVCKFPEHFLDSQIEYFVKSECGGV